MIKPFLPLLLLITHFAFSQSLPIDFENNIVTADFVDFDGGTASVLANPQSSGINTSATVAQIVRDGGAIWSGSKIYLTDNLEFSSMNIITMKVFTSAPVGTVVKFKLEGAGNTERDAQTSVSGAWEELSWDFTGEPTNFNTLVFMFDFGNVGNGTASSTFLFDDVQQYFGGSQLDLPVTFEEAGVNYSMTDFGGNESMLITDPFDPNNTAMQVVKTVDAATWAGTNIGTPAGFSSNIPLSLNESIMTARVWSPLAGTPIRLKVEDSNDPTHTCETQTNSTMNGAWETLVFDFNNQATGTELLSVGLSMGWTYNMASIFFNFGTEGAVSGEKTYYFDDVQFGQSTVGNSSDPTAEIRIEVYPNPTSDIWKISSANQNIIAIVLFDVLGNQLSVQTPNTKEAMIHADELSKGTYFVSVSTNLQKQIIHLVKN
ncbi:MAG: T9SS type A sorting domain-containing protein [Crocinitomicaceae bacterium]|jgi:hypothetical protein|tara:strand:- start:53754 stop:55046 length:1293 start_codon:yes stop_codon:yes gene_type:complete